MADNQHNVIIVGALIVTIFKLTCNPLFFNVLIL